LASLVAELQALASDSTDPVADVLLRRVEIDATKPGLSGTGACADSHLNAIGGRARHTRFDPDAMVRDFGREGPDSCNERPADNNATSPILAYSKRGPLPEERRYWKSLLEEDDLGEVVRTSTFLESHLETILRRHFLDPTATVNVRGIAYMRRAELASALGEFDAKLVKTLKILDELRGEFGHDHTYEVDDKALQKLLASLEDHVAIVYEQNMENTFAESSEEVQYATAHLSEPKRQLRAALDAIRTVVGMIARSSFDLQEHVLDRLAAHYNVKRH